MKNLFFSLIAIVMVSVSGFANSIKTEVDIKPIKTELVFGLNQSKTTTNIQNTFNVEDPKSKVILGCTECGLQSVTWSAANCTITGQGTINATITPNSTVANGSTIDISAVVSYVGGCSALTQVTRFTVFDGGNTTPPVGTVSISANPPNVPLQNTSEWLTSFTMQKGTSINYNNGIFVLNPTVLQVESYGRTATVEVCYLNVCGGNQSCANFQVWVPGIANWNPYRMANPKGDNKIEPQKLNTVFPNPTNGLITIAFEKNMNGTYQIFDINGMLIVDEGKVNNQTELQIELSQKLKSGIYILKVNTENNSFTEKIILNR